MPLKRRDGSYFGTLCALDPHPAQLSEQDLEIFHLLASLIAFELEADESHQQIARILESIGDGFVALDHEWRLTYVNRKAEELWGRRREDLLGEIIWEVFPEAVGSELHQKICGAAAERRPVAFEALSAVIGKWLEVHVYPSEDGLSVYFQDITERRALEQMHRTFTAMAAHELRNPIASIKGFAQLMRRRGTYSERGAETIVDQAEQLGRLVNDLLDASLLDAAQLQLQRQPVDLAALVRTSAGRVTSIAEQHTVRVDAPRGMRSGHWDCGRLDQVLQNLLSNAIKYSPEGGEIMIQVEDLGEQARVSVADRGMGIPAEVLPRLFERFYRTETAVASAIRGTGLGLYITRGLVEAHGGRIWVQSRPGEGSTFTFTLPYEIPDERAGGPAELTSRQLEVAALIGRGWTNRQIAGELVLTEGTVANHVVRILNKLGFQSRSQVAAWAVERGLVAPVSAAQELSGP